jgi:hypothetical protein
MKTQLIILSLFIAFTCSTAQVVSPPKYDFEKVEWGDHLTKIRKQFSKKNISEMKTSDNPFVKKMEGKFMYGYTDTINAQKVGILFQFNSMDSTLESIILASMLNDPDKKDEKDKEAKGKEILTLFTKHYPVEFQERSIPLMGTVRLWSLNKTSAQAYLLSSMVSLILMRK